MSPTPIYEEIITKEFLQKALQREANGQPVPEILSYSVTLGTKAGDNFMSIIYAVDVELSDGKKRHLFIKCYPKHPLRQDFSNKSNVFFKELEVYSKWIPELERFQMEVLGLDKKDVVKLPYAHFVDGECIDFESEEGKSRISQPIQSLENFIIMDDLRKTHGFRMEDSRKPLDLDHMLLVVEALAKTHALSWVYRHRVEANVTNRFPCLVSKMKTQDISVWRQVVFSGLDLAKSIFDNTFSRGNAHSTAVDRFRKHFVAACDLYTGKSTGEGLESLFRVFKPHPGRFGMDAENPEPWRVISHGDCWSNNMLFRYDNTTGKPIEVALVDLQMPQESCVVYDLQYAIYTSTNLPLRRYHLDQLLQLYHDTFNNVCALTKTPILPGFCMNSLRFRFHRSKFLGYFVAIIILPMMLREEGKAVDMEELNLDDTGLAESVSKLVMHDDGTNSLLKERLMEVTASMMEEGVL